jgi:hypothetical protein
MRAQTPGATTAQEGETCLNWLAELTRGGAWSREGGLGLAIRADHGPTIACDCSETTDVIVRRCALR